MYRLVYCDTFAVSTRVLTRQENFDIAQPYKINNLAAGAPGGRIQL